jgi:hypothetical protein
MFLFEERTRVQAHKLGSDNQPTYSCKVLNQVLGGVFTQYSSTRVLAVQKYLVRATTSSTKVVPVHSCPPSSSPSSASSLPAHTTYKCMHLLDSLQCFYNTILYCTALFLHSSNNQSINQSMWLPKNDGGTYYVHNVYIHCSWTNYYSSSTTHLRKLFALIRLRHSLLPLLRTLIRTVKVYKESLPRAKKAS